MPSFVKGIGVIHGSLMGWLGHVFGSFYRGDHGNILRRFHRRIVRLVMRCIRIVVPALEDVVTLRM
jgi:hypothetical protein